jgi:O-antigen ligase
MLPTPPAAGQAAIGAPRVRRAAAARGRAARSMVSALTWDPIRLALAAMMLVSIAQIHKQFPVLQVLRPGILLTAVALGLALMLPRSINGKDLFSTWPARRVLALLGIALVTAPFGLNLPASLTFLSEVYVPNLVFFGLLVVAARNVGDLRMLIGSFVVSQGILVYLSLFVWETTTFFGFQRMTSPLMYDSNDLGTIFAAGIPLCLLFAQSSRGVLRWLGYAIAAGSPATIALSGSRGGFLALIATGIGLLVMMPRVTWGRRIGVLLVATLVMAVVAPSGYLSKMNTIVNPGDDYNVTSETGRIAIWKRGLANLAPRPLTGVGIGNFVRAQWVNQLTTATGSPVRAQSPHNTFVQVAVDLGIPAFLLFASILLGCMFGLARIRSRLPTSWLRESAERRFLYIACSYLPVSFFGWSVGAFFVSHAYLMPFYILVAYTCGVLLLLRREMRREPRVAAVRASLTPGIAA